ncbi:MAG: HAD-IIIA family hydrolase [Candidatus Omnitrophica bacterium]|nr:HAD-IIIA family hydrolase [Candidatus Omnitrophota bacterium]
MVDENVSLKTKNIKLLILDADGVLTDGKIYYGSYGDELKAFDVKDGLGLNIWNKAGYLSCILTAKRSPLLRRRAKHVKIMKVYQNAYRKIDIYNRLKRRYKLNDENICFIGDDLIDIAVLKRCGFSVTVPGAPEEVKSQADYVTENKGGDGAVREVIELILKSQNLWQGLVQSFG